MGKRSRGRHPELEAVESRALLSGGAGGALSTAVPISPTPTQFILLNGTLRGHYHANPSIPDVGTTYVASGSGHVHDVGHAFVTGQLHSIGFIAEGHAQGDLYLSGARGTIALHLTGVQQQDGPKGLPDVFSFSVMGGTGKYIGVQDSGTAIYVGIPSHSSAGAQAAQHGRFVLVLTSNPIPF
jgi:hypothetical protein